MHINTEAQNEMLKVIEKEDLSLDAYHAINDSKDTEFIPDLPEEDFEKYESLSKNLENPKRLKPMSIKSMLHMIWIVRNTKQ